MSHKRRYRRRISGKATVAARSSPLVNHQFAYCIKVELFIALFVIWIVSSRDSDLAQPKTLHPFKLGHKNLVFCYSIVKTSCVVDPV